MHHRSIYTSNIRVPFAAAGEMIAAAPAATKIQLPTSQDILCGKDKSLTRWQGNVLFHEVLASYSSVYNDEKVDNKKSHRAKMTREIVDRLKSVHNARFLKPTADGDWVEISDGAARDKVSHAMRFAAKKILAARKLESARALKASREPTRTTLDPRDDRSQDAPRHLTERMRPAFRDSHSSSSVARLAVSSRVGPQIVPQESLTDDSSSYGCEDTSHAAPAMQAQGTATTMTASSPPRSLSPPSTPPPRPSSPGVILGEQDEPQRLSFFPNDCCDQQEDFLACFHHQDGCMLGQPIGYYVLEAGRNKSSSFTNTSSPTLVHQGTAHVRMAYFEDDEDTSIDAFGDNELRAIFD